MTDRQKLKYTLDGLFFTKILFETSEKTKKDFIGDIKTKCKIEASGVVDNELIVYLNVISNSEVCEVTPYKIDVEVTSKLTLKDELEITEDLEKAMVRNAVSISYGAVREKILELTSRSVWGPAIIPPEYFFGLSRKSEDDND